MTLIEFTIIAPWAIILIYVTVFIMTLFVMLQIDFGQFFKKEMQTPLMGMILTMIVSLVITFCIGSLLVVLSSCMINLF